LRYLRDRCRKQKSSCQVHTSSCNKSSSSRFKFRESKDKREGPRASDYSLLVFPAGAFGLGLWQYKRRHWKLDLIEELDHKTHCAPIELSGQANDARLEYRPVKASGVFDHSREHYIGPRSLLLLGEEQQSKGLSSDPNTIGWHVVTPLKVTAGEMEGKEILVNRGWVPMSRVKPSTRLEGQVKGEVEVTGIIRRTEPRPQFAPKNNLESDQWQHRDIPALAGKLGTEPVFIDANLATTVDGGPIGGQTRVTLRNEHMSYMLTWFSLSAITTYMWYVKFIR